MVVHSAATKGYTDIVMIFLAADNLVDLNTPTFHTKETISNLAVKNGHRDLYKKLCSVRADLTMQDKLETQCGIDLGHEI
ncbi:hypothetical protein F442_08905 [Phytophthora nicotianae P10297]|uniref:Uncharacterized protein n=4 Tax=Phytophthora nicotianae TaxID=4792 RepID=V9F8C8_PHYNI|nr:hypothetical protein F443_08974 [Phytophthora nicotianae P1569]ETL93125.1 hypothetical protein L917_08644 [Phytophthora nicotianae]ETM46416.1 hypothetical protein L914_08678 [Phytophthora nicotianae]ETO75349.1 hypothetical protein F444_09034 [Phytophthora nicotianae P1976]ETP44503.1 hypothetical protein F442_08905 [Phytophthora nicotianae P10297]